MLDRPLYDIACEQIDEDRLDASRWQMSEWHPDGAHLWNDTGLNIVVTAFTTDHMADIGVYTDGEMNDPVLFKQCRLYDIGGTLHGLMDFYDIGDPLPAPWPSAVELAATYIAEVRANGPESMANVANAHDDGMACEIGYEVGEAWARFGGDIDWGTSPLVDDASDLCAEAAGLAIDAFRRELTR